MTVKVIKTEPDAQVIKYTVCRNCGVTLQYVPRDVQEYVHHDYGGGSDTVYYIKCPECNKQVNVRGY
jgi:uncharacterized protein with PIN domain